MSKLELTGGYKIIGTQSQEEFTNTNWQPHTTSEIPLGTLVSNPNGFLWAHGSANCSLATTSREGVRYTADWFVFRRDKDHVNTDRYFVLESNNRIGTVVMQPKNQNPFHVVSPDSPIVDELPDEEKQWLEKIINYSNED